MILYAAALNTITQSLV